MKGVVLLLLALMAIWFAGAAHGQDSGTDTGRDARIDSGRDAGIASCRDTGRDASIAAYGSITSGGGIATEKVIKLPARINRVPEGNDFNDPESDFSFSRMIESPNVAIF